MSDSTDPTPLPDEVEEALAYFYDSPDRADNQMVSRLCAHIAALTAERDALRCRVDYDSLSEDEKALFRAPDVFASRRLEERDRCARIEALEWALERIRIYYPLMKLNSAAAQDIEDELARLKGEAVSGGQG